MPLEPKIKIEKENYSQTKECLRCKRVLTLDNFAVSHSLFYGDKRIPICHSCATDYLRLHDFAWEAADKLCQWADIPFVVREWERLSNLNDSDSLWKVYTKVFSGAEYEGLGWSHYDKQYRKLREVGLIEEEIPEVREQKYLDLKRKWGSNYDEESLNYLEDLYKGLLTTQNVNGALQVDQAQKICKLSLEIDSRIRAGDKDVDKFLASYDRLVKTAEFTPKNTKNAADFDSFAEVAMWLEKRGRQNKFYDGTTRDIIDETLKNIENYNQRLYINEGGIGEEITERLNALKNSQEQETFYGIQQEYDLDEYDNAAYQLEEEKEDFEVEVEDDGGTD